MNNDLQFLEDNFICQMGNRNYADRSVHLIIKKPETNLNGFDRFRFKLGYKMYKNKVSMILYEFELPITKYQENVEFKEEISILDNTNTASFLLKKGNFNYGLTRASNFHISHNGKYKLHYIKRFIQQNPEDILDGSSKYTQELLLKHFNNLYKQNLINSCPSYNDLVLIERAITYFNENLLASSYYPHAETDVEGYYHEMKRVSFLNLLDQDNSS